MGVTPDVSVVNDLANGPRIAELTPMGPQDQPYKIEAASIIQAVPHLVKDQQETRTQHESNDENHDVVQQLTEVTDNYELDSANINKNVNVKGRLKAHFEFWKRIGTSKYILSVIKDGYVVPFNQVPPSRDLKNNNSVLTHGDFVEEAINELIFSGRVLELKQKPHVVNPLSVSVQKSGKKRLILDLRHVNQFLEKEKVKFEDWKVALNYFQKGSYMISFDLKSGYHHIEINSESQTFLGFAWNFDANRTRRRYFVFTVLPFGLSTAPYIFMKTLRPLVKYWRFNALNLALFLDDGWLTERDEDTCK